MNHKLKYIPLVFFFWAAFVFILCPSALLAQQAGGVAGQKAPDFGLNTWIDGNGDAMDPVSLDAYKDRVIYLLFFQDWCPGCQKYGFPTLKQVADHFKNNEGIKFFAIQTVFEGSLFNTASKLKKNQKNHDIKIPMAHDGEALLMKKYRSRGTPWVVIINKEGIVKYNAFHIKPKPAIAMIHQLLGSTDVRSKK